MRMVILLVNLIQKQLSDQMVILNGVVQWYFDPRAKSM